MKIAENTATSTRIAYSVEDAARVTGLGRTTIYGLIGNGTLPSVKIGNRRLIRHADLEMLLSGTAAASTAPQPANDKDMRSTPHARRIPNRGHDVTGVGK